MKNKKVLLIFTIASSLLTTIILFMGYYKIIICPGYIGDGGKFCIAKFGTNIAEPILFINIFIMLIFIVLLFFKKEIFDFWKKFALVYLPIALILIFLTPTSGDFYGILERENVSILLGVLYTIVSLILIIYKSIKLRGK